jgi:hypothetical protein
MMQGATIKKINNKDNKENKDDCYMLYNVPTVLPLIPFK